MSKELEALKELKHWKETNNENGVVWLPLFAVEDIEQSLQRLESIDNSTPSEALECLDGIEYVADVLKVNHKIGSRDIANQEIKEMVARLYYRIPTIKQALIQAEQDKKEKELLEADLKIELNNKKNAVDMFKEELALNRELKKKEQAWDIVVSKRVDLQLIKSCSTVQEYYEKANRLYGANYNKELLTEQEFTTLKEVVEE